MDLCACTINVGGGKFRFEKVFTTAVFSISNYNCLTGAVPKKLQVVIVHVVELQTVTSYNVTRSQNVLVTLQHVQLQVTTGKTGKNSSKK